ncbi:universal stress protein [Microvirga yunnanensis]|uniref:universal stress protein n=1 Tax=Microvirga yunnanensis TaxID=2953740 RepID=UPI0021C72E54|nr:universal stress protein [Microvirga sp. HBU65207]
MHILAATDFSTRSQRAVRRAGLLARDCGAELTLVHVVDDDQIAAVLPPVMTEGPQTSSASF